MPIVDLTGRIAAVTGASSGIGEATALALARAGCAVSLAARRNDRIDALAQRIEEAGGRALALSTDVSNEAAARSFVTRTHDELGGLDVLVNNAGVMLLGPFETQTGEDWRRMIEVNCLGLLYCTNAALPLMRESGGGHVVNVSSIAGRRASAFSAAYNMTKFGVTGFSEALRQEALHVGVRVTVVEPGFVETELQGHNEGKDVVMQATDKMKQKIGEVLTADDIAEAILYAVSQPERVNVSEILVVPRGTRD